jgi:ubiquinone/menaquinone biosynthesis C-methylase UbiE
MKERVMKLNGIERALINNPIRAALQRHYEAQKLLRMGGPARGGHCLEVGCGRGIGIEILFDRFGAEHVDAFDLDPKMIELAKQRLARRRNVRLWTGSATDIRAAEAIYDAVFDFGIIHHIPDWRAALREIHRVLKPGGRFYADEVLAEFIHHPVWRVLLDHPKTDRFDRRGFERGLMAAGFDVITSNELFGQFAFFVAEKPDRP